MYAFIVNPNSRSGLGLKIWEQLELILKERHIDYQIYFTRRPGHGARLAAQICDTDAHTLVVLGGDGTIGEVVDGIRDLTKLTLAYIPIGSGNDCQVYEADKRSDESPLTYLKSYRLRVH